MRFLQSLFQAPPRPDADEIQQRLMLAFNFTDADLKVNHKGKMSNHQHYWLVDRLLRETLICIAVAGVAGWILTNYVQGNPIFRIVNDPFWLIVGGIAFFAATVYGLGNLWDTSIDLIRRQVSDISGIVHLGLHSRNRNRIYTLEIGDIRFEIPEKTRHAVIDGEVYTVYYAPCSRIILAVEVEKQKRKNDY